MTIVLGVCLVVLGVAAALTLYRMTQGPTMLDRAIANYNRDMAGRRKTQQPTLMP